jgi:putative endonuclease
MTNSYYVYIMTNKANQVLYTGVTNDLARRVTQHRDCGATRSFTARYKVHKLVHIEEFGDIRDAIARKAGSRAKKARTLRINQPRLERPRRRLVMRTKRLPRRLRLLAMTGLARCR